MDGNGQGLGFRVGGLPPAEQAFDRYRAIVRGNAVARAAAALRQLIPTTVLTDHELAELAGVAVDGAWPAFCELADLFGSQGRLVARQWGVIDELRWELERRNLADLANQLSTRNGRTPT